jgi:teichuronic acid biosynthesis glycosyltransferase TuaG
MSDIAPVTVIVPCFNCASTIEKSLESILNQTLWPMEIILIDDASKDNTCLIIENLIEEYTEHKIFLIKLKENSGPGMARNAGWQVATQPWIAFLDADDIWHPEKIKVQWGIIKQNVNIDLCGHNSELYSSLIPKKPIERINIRQINFTEMLFSNKFPTRSIMLRSDIQHRFYGKDVTEDYLLWLEIVSDRYNCFKIESTLAFSLRPEFTIGGYSGQLWKHEKRELNAFNVLYKKQKINFLYLLFFTIFSFLKYIRRVLIIQFLNKHKLCL